VRRAVIDSYRKNNRIINGLGQLARLKHAFTCGRRVVRLISREPLGASIGKLRSSLRTAATRSAETQHGRATRIGLRDRISMRLDTLRYRMAVQTSVTSWCARTERSHIST
jgi:hypothetical protein